MSSHAGRGPRHGFLASERALARPAQRIHEFLGIEAAGGVLLIVATFAALVWVNVFDPASYERLWSTELTFEFGSYTFAEDLGHLVNDLLMAFFFLVVGMEIKRELVVGELRSPRAVALPAMAALGGMVVPAGIFALVNAGGANSDGWGIPMATDIAFALGVVALLGDRVPSPVKLLLLSLAIVDDIGAIVVIAVFYSDGIAFDWLLAAAITTAVLAALHRLDVVYAPALVTVGIALWLCVYESGVHATIAGVVIGLLTPARPRLSDADAEQIVDTLERRDQLDANEVRATTKEINAAVSDANRAIDALHPWTSFVIVPVFALANAGIELRLGAFTSPSAVFLGVAAGLVVGKLLGVSLFVWLAVKLGLAGLPADVRPAHIVGVGAVAGIGFTVSIFVAGLALDGTALADAKAAIIAASLLASTIGAAILSRAGASPVAPLPPTVASARSGTPHAM